MFQSKRLYQVTKEMNYYINLGISQGVLKYIYLLFYDLNLSLYFKQAEVAQE